MSMIEVNLATPRVLCSFRAWIESSKHGHEEMIGNQQQKELKRSQKMRLIVGLKMSRKRKPHLSPGKTRKTMKLYSGSLYLFEKMVRNMMM